MKNDYIKLNEEKENLVTEYDKLNELNEKLEEEINLTKEELQKGCKCNKTIY